MGINGETGGSSRLRRGLAGFAVWLLAAAALAEGTPAEQCMRISDSLERVACYDRLHGRHATVAPGRVAAPQPGQRESHPSPASTAPVPTRSVANASAQPEDSEGVANLQQELGAEQLPRSRIEQQQSKPSELVSRVLAMGEGSTRRTWFRLENGQLWEQKSIETTNINEGDEVRVRRSTFGAYVMRRADGSSRSTKVLRRQ